MRVENGGRIGGLFCILRLFKASRPCSCSESPRDLADVLHEKLSAIDIKTRLLNVSMNALDFKQKDNTRNL